LIELYLFQATKFTPDHVDERIEAFIYSFLNKKLQNLSDEEFNTAVQTLIKQNREPDITLNNEFSRNWYEISSQDYLFDRREKEIKVYETLEKAAMIEIMSNLLSKDNKQWQQNVFNPGAD
jgi:secreted Zn-dependent insulinase-like peptidase